MGLLGIETALNVLSGMNQPGSVKLGGFVFASHEVPPNLTVTVEQALTIHKLPGGGRIMDVGGDDPASLSFNGTLLGPRAVSRAKQIDAIRAKGLPVTLTIAQQQWRVMVRTFAYTYAKKGTVVSYHLLAEICVDPSASGITSLSGLSNTTHAGVLSALGSVTQAISGVSSLVGNFSGAAQNVLGQVTPIANIIGLGGPLATASSKLTMVSGLADAGQNLANMPQALRNTISGLKDTEANFSTALMQSGTNLDSIQDGTVSSRVATMQNATAALGALEGKAAANVANQNAQRIAR